jgi:hypothetical protein
VEAGRRGVGAVLCPELQRAVGAAEADAGQRVDDEAPAVGAASSLVPARRLVAVHHVAGSAQVGPGEHRLHLGRQRQRALGVPLRHHAGVHAQPAVGAQGQRARAHPVEPGVAVGCGQDVAQRVAAVGGAARLGHRQQMQVVVADQAGGAGPEAAQAPQRAQRVRAAIHEVAQHHQVVARG